jgi:L-amino acid N-acyltransferase YncA
MPYEKHGYPRALILKDGSEVNLRPLKQDEDEEALLEFFNRVSDKDRWYLVDDVADQDLVRNWARNINPNKVLPVVAATKEGRILAVATLHRYTHGARKHIGRIRLVVDADYRNKRLGTYLLLDLIQLAMDLGLSLLRTQFIQGVEDKAIRAARRLDFFEQAVLRDYAKDHRGNYYDLVIMIKRLHRGYDDF